MALATQAVGRAVVTPTAFAAPTVSEKIAPGPGVYLWVKIGATATTITLNRYGSFPSGTALPDEVLTALTSTERIIPITREYANPADSNLALVEFSQIANVTALLLTVAGS